MHEVEGPCIDLVGSSTRFMIEKGNEENQGLGQDEEEVVGEIYPYRLFPNFILKVLEPSIERIKHQILHQWVLHVIHLGGA